MRHRSQYIFIFMLLMIAIASSCSSDVDALQQEPLVPDYEHPISIAIDKKESRAMHEQLTNENLKSDFFGVYAYFTGSSDYKDSTTPNSFLYLANTKFKPQEEGRTVIWHGDPNVYYPLGETNLTFVAYAPYDSINSQLKSVDFTRDAIDITYAPAQNVEKQIDFCVAEPKFNQKSTSDSLPIAFNHMLTNVSFYAKVTVGKADIGVKVDKLTLKNILGENVLRWTPTDTTTAYKWVEATNPKYVDYVMTSSLPHTHLHKSNIANIKDDNGNAAYVCLQNASGYLYLLPQTFDNNNGAYVEIEYSLHALSGEELKDDETFIDFVTKIPIPKTVDWLPAHKIRYNMDIHISNITEVSIVGVADESQVGVVEWESVNPEKSESNSFEIE